MKQRLTSIDIRALVMTLRRKVLSLRVANIYDISNKIYLFKLAAKGVKEFLLIEAGIRMHTTEFVRNKNSIPSGFIMKLRKHLRTKRIEEINQVGIDRVVDITLGQGDKAYHILIEFYASGNLILTDHEYNILSLLRTHRYDEDTRCAVGEKYPFTLAANMSINSITKDKAGVESVVEELKGEEKATEDGKQKKKKGKDKDVTKTVFSKMVPYTTPALTDHCFASVGIQEKTKFDLKDEELIQKLLSAASMAKEMVQGLEDSEIIPGYIIYEEVKEAEPNEDDLLKDQKTEKDNSHQKEENKQETLEQLDANKQEQPLEVKPVEELKQEAKQKQKKEEGEGDSD